MPPIELNYTNAGLFARYNSTISDDDLKKIIAAEHVNQVNSTWGAIKDWFFGTKTEVVKEQLFNLLQDQQEIYDLTKTNEPSNSIKLQESHERALERFAFLSECLSDTGRDKLKLVPNRDNDTAKIEIIELNINVTVHVPSDTESKKKLEIFPSHQITNNSPATSTKDCDHYCLTYHKKDQTCETFKIFNESDLTSIKQTLNLNDEQFKILNQLACPAAVPNCKINCHSKYYIDLDIQELDDQSIAVFVKHTVDTSEMGFPFGGHQRETHPIYENFIITPEKLVSTYSNSLKQQITTNEYNRNKYSDIDIDIDIGFYNNSNKYTRNHSGSGSGSDRNPSGSRARTRIRFYVF
jgi:hypothetical protein